MAEQFIEDIYLFAKIPFGLRLCSLECNNKDSFQVRNIWNRYSDALAAFVNDCASFDMELSKRMLSTISKIQAHISDSSLCEYYINRILMPDVMIALGNYGGIDVTEGIYNLFSSETGFINVRNTENHTIYHSMIDPLWESWNYARKLYTPDLSSVVIMGVGLGYLAYELWECSNGSLDIYIYENDPQIIEYAHRYGVLDWISPENLHIIIEENLDSLFSKYVSAPIDYDHSRMIISDWMIDMFSGDTRLYALDFYNNQKSVDRFMHSFQINYWQNKKNNPAIFENEIETCVEEINKNNSEIMVIAAGPSFGDNLLYVKAHMNDMPIIAVDIVFKKLIREGIRPDYIALLDPQNSGLNYIEGVEDKTEDCVLLAEGLANWKYVKTFRGKKLRILGNDLSNTLEEAYEAGISTWDVTGTVSGLGIEAAIRMGAKKIYMIGLDLAYPENQMYTPGLESKKNENCNCELMVDSVDGGKVATTLNFDLFRRQIETKIVQNSDVNFINMSKHGAYISGAEAFY